MAAVALVTLGAADAACGAGGIVDSGWATAAPAEAGSVIQSQRVPIRQLLPGDVVDRLAIPPRTRPTRPRNRPTKVTAPRTASRQPVDRWRARTGGAPQIKVEAADPERLLGDGESSAADSLAEDDISSAFALPGEAVGPARPPAQPPATNPPAAGGAAKPTPPAKPEDAKADAPQAVTPEAEPSTAPSQATPRAKPAAGAPEPAEPAPSKPETAKPKASAGEPKATAEGDAGDSESIAPREPAPFPGWAVEPEAEEPEPGANEPAENEPPAEEPPATKTKPAPTAEPEVMEPKPEPNKLRIGDDREPITREPGPKAERKPAKQPPAEELTPVVQPPKIGIAGALRPASPPSRPLTRSQQYLRRRLRSVLSYYYRRPLNSRDHNSWEVMHSMLSYGLHSRIIDRTAGSKPVTAIGYLCFNKPCQGKRLLRLSPEGELDAEVAYGIQGHHGQFLAMLAQCNVSPDYPVRVGDKKLTIRNVIAFEKRTCRVDSELSFKLISLAHFSDLDESWRADDGEVWTVSRLIDEERNQKIRGAACGGTHRLAGLALAKQIRVARGEPLDGQFLAAKEFVDEHVKYAFRLQNRDGSLSTEWFRGPGDEEDINRRIRTSGHLLEWLLYALPQERLTDSRTVRAVNYVTSLLASNTDNAWEIGPLSHALHALLLYDERVFQPHDKPTQVAGRPTRPAPRLAYQSITGKVSGTYPSSDEAERLREEAAAPTGLRGLFGIGRSPAGRRSR